jgi:hypothetical protein
VDVVQPDAIQLDERALGRMPALGPTGGKVVGHGKRVEASVGPADDLSCGPEAGQTSGEIQLPVLGYGLPRRDARAVRPDSNALPPLRLPLGTS